MEIKGRGELDTFFLNYSPSTRKNVNEDGDNDGIVDFDELHQSCFKDHEPGQPNSTQPWRRRSKKSQVRVSLGDFVVSKTDRMKLTRLVESSEDLDNDEERQLDISGMPSSELDFPSEEVVKGDD